MWTCFITLVKRKWYEEKQERKYLQLPIYKGRNENAVKVKRSSSVFGRPRK